MNQKEFNAGRLGAAMVIAFFDEGDGDRLSSIAMSKIKMLESMTIDDLCGGPDHYAWEKVRPAGDGKSFVWKDSFTGEQRTQISEPGTRQSGGDNTGPPAKPATPALQPGRKPGLMSWLEIGKNPSQQPSPAPQPRQQPQPAKAPAKPPYKPDGSWVSKAIQDAAHVHEKVSRLSQLPPELMGRVAEASKARQSFQKKNSKVNDQLNALGARFRQKGLSEEEKAEITKEDAKLREEFKDNAAHASRAAASEENARHEVGMAVHAMIRLEQGKFTAMVPASFDPSYQTPEKIKIARGAAFLTGIVAKGPNGESVAPIKFVRDPQCPRDVYLPDSHAVSLRQSASGFVVVHEMMHATEHMLPGVYEAAMDFLDHRCGDEQPVSMGRTFPGSGYKDDEMVRKDKFADMFGEMRAHYVGKTYAHKGVRATEVVTMGIQTLYDDPQKFAKTDPEYCAFILGILDGTLRKPGAKQ